MSENPTLLKMLESKDSEKRREACDELEASPSISDEALAALRKVSQDPNPDVANAARRALSVHIRTNSDKKPSSTKTSKNIAVEATLVLGSVLLAVLLILALIFIYIFINGGFGIT